jgi:hypothetical protein
MNRHFFCTAALLLALGLAACASNSAAPTAPTAEGFGNILVLAIADDYEARARYERAVSSNLRKLGVAATPYHEAVGGSGQISRDTANQLIAQQQFDAVLVTQVRDSNASIDVQQDSAAAKVTRKNARPVDFFRYDYEELDEPGEISLLAKAVLDSDLHRAGDGEVVWSFSWSNKKAENVGLLVDEASAAVVRRLDRDKMLGN